MYIFYLKKVILKTSLPTPAPRGGGGVIYFGICMAPLYGIELMFWRYNCSSHKWWIVPHISGGLMLLTYEKK